MQPTGKQLAMEGMAAAAAHAEERHPNWNASAEQYVVQFARLCPTGFLTEDVRRWAENEGLPPAPDARAWGAVIRTCARRGSIESAGYFAAQNRSAHAGPRSLWKQGRSK